MSVRLHYFKLYYQDIYTVRNNKFVHRQHGNVNSIDKYIYHGLAICLHNNKDLLFNLPKVIEVIIYIHQCSMYVYLV